MDIGRTTATIETQALIVRVQYYRDMCPRRSHVLHPLKEAASGPNGTSSLQTDGLEVAFCEINHLVSAETLLNYPDQKIPSTVNIDVYDKNLGDVIIKNDKPIALFLIKLSNPQHNYTTTQKGLLLIVQFLTHMCGLIFG